MKKNGKGKNKENLGKDEEEVKKEWLRMEKEGIGRVKGKEEKRGEG